MTSRLPSLLCLIGLLTPTQPAFAATDPPPLFVADITYADPAQSLLAVTLQGLANSHPDGPRVFLLTNPRDAEWLDYCLRLAPRSAQFLTVPELLEVLKPELAGQILYDPDQPYTLDIATTAAGIHQSVISPTDLGLPTILDLRGRWRSAAEAYRWAAESLLQKCSRNKAALLPPDVVSMRDFAIQQRLFTLSPPPSPDSEVLGDILFHLSPGAAIYGAAPPPLRPSFSRASHYFVSAAYAANLSFFSRLDAKRHFYQYLGYIEPTAPRYLTLIFDCSQLDFAVNDMPALWDDPTRGTVPLGWAIPAALADAAPPVLHRYYADAYRSGMDQFLLAPGGAGEADLATSKSPYAFFETTARSQTVLDINTACYRAPAAQAELGPAVARFAAETQTRGVFVIGAPAMPPFLYDGIPAISAPRVDSVGAAIDYLNNIPLDRRAAALLLDPRKLGPAEAAHIAAHVSDRYVIVPPEEMVELMRIIAQPAQPAASTVRLDSVNYPDPAPLDLPIPIRATFDTPGRILSASVVYRPKGHPLLFWEPMSATHDGYVAHLPPLLRGGEMELRIRARDRAGRVAWLADWTLDIPRSDADADGLSDAEERFLLTDPDAPDTDADGLRDAADPSPLRLDRVSITYRGPIYPPSDLTYLPDSGGSHANSQGRHLQPGQTCLYWLPLGRLPPAAPAVVALDAVGPAALDLGADPSLLVRQFTGELPGIWHSAILPPETERGGVFLRASCPADAQSPLLVSGLAIISPPASPSIARLSHTPAHPGPEQSITISALIFSPDGISGADLTYRVNDGGTITFPMNEVQGSQYYQARIPSLDNRDQLEWWITARDSQGDQTVTSSSFLSIGGRAREVISLLARRDFYGDWISAPDWNGASRLAPAPGLRDSAPVNLTGGTYTVWMLAGGRGQSIALHVRNNKVGSLDPRRPDGWQRIGRIRLEAARHLVTLVSESRPESPPDAAPRYASVIFSADPSFVPPADGVLDIYNSIVLLAPRSEEILHGRVELKATGAGNLSSADFSVDGESSRRASGPPFHLLLNTARFPNGPHTLRVEAVDRAGPTGLAVEIPIIIAN